MSRLRQGTNRVALFCGAAALLASGAALASATPPRHWPARWPRLGTDRVWLDAAALSRWRAHDWWPAAVIGGLSIGLLLLVAWAVLQIRSGRLRELPLGRPDVTLTVSALASAMTERARTVDGVARVRVRLLGRPRRLRAQMTVTLAPDASPETVLRDLSRHVVTEARAAVAPRILAADVRLRVQSHASRHVH
ncbi:hypothetical protein ACGFSB_02880 [Streptomyces sp. NPDC048441]|uniref:hypothetical protein n=1 Tax=Streptomyces sp. NPDC048441 TaxID=3365552 RepID=UPI0037200E10